MFFDNSLITFRHYYYANVRRFCKNLSYINSHTIIFLNEEFFSQIYTFSRERVEEGYLRQGPALEGRNSPVVAKRFWKGNK